MENKYQIGDALRERGLKDNVSRFECGGCGQQASVIDPAGIANLVEHCMHDHLNRENVMAVRYEYDYAPAWDVAWQMGLAAQTQAEQQWREMKARAA